ncbi:MULTISPECIES: efflux RND transporter permease subunit [Pseudoalteromonas]|uniref:Acriflavin resistance protein n=1 Tax=Pseudoalteromonas amylolytica TaxID=1859457 RepID=A0A1S1MT55_9GAMM|nr:MULTISPECIES: efflux RND transporter permease subunit [Pseudoalteromonas]OHU84365.1 acriflavin resistance protein [Pseudoalteromonas sp. JW3]OHU87096.1 acriflavin resistance protein [Pseudoalteromonas amylolytica]
MIAFFARHPTAANLLMLMICIAGLVALPDLKRETFPEFSRDKVKVSVVYPGASPSEVEQALCVVMEEAIDSVNGIATQSCESREGVANLTVEAQEGIAATTLLQDVKTQIDAIDNFPQQIEAPIVQELGRDQHLISLVVGAALPLHELKRYAQQLKDKLKRQTNIDIVDIEGFSDQQIQVELSLFKLREYGLSANDLVVLLQKQNIKLPLGEISEDGKTMAVRFDQQRVTAQDLAGLVIKSHRNGEQIYVRDVATLSESFELDEEQVVFNGQRVALLSIKKAKHQDAIKLVDEVSQFVEQQQKLAPQGVTLTLTQNTAQIIEDRLTMLLGNGWQGFVLVLVVMYLFFSFRYSFWVSMGLPVSFLGAFALMALMGVSINMISMVALLMSIGILMDDAIVIAESIATKVEQGQALDADVIKGVTQVAPGVFSSFLTTIAVFVGLAFISGDIGKVLKDIPLVLIATIFVSIIEAFFILPNHLLHSLRHNQQQASSSWRFKQSFTRAFEQFRATALTKSVHWCVQQRYLFIGAVLLLFFTSVALMAGGIVKFKAFPQLEGDTLEVRLLLPPGSTLSDTQAVVAKYTQALTRVDNELSKLESSPLVEHLTVQYNRNSDAYEQGEHLATIRVDLLTAQQRRTQMTQLIELWRAQVSDVSGLRAVSFKEPTLGPAGRAIEIRLHGEQLSDLMTASETLKAQLAQYVGVTNVMDDLRLGKHEWRVSLKPGALSLGIDGNAIATQLRSALFGQIATEVQRDNTSIEVYVRLQERDKSSVDSLLNYPITLNTGQQVPLGNLAQLSLEQDVTRVNRVDGQRTVTITADVDALLANTNEVISQLQKQAITPLLAQNPQLSVSYEGEIKTGTQTGQSMAGKFLLGLVAVFVILSFQFRSYFEPIMVMLAIPLALIGVVWGHFLLGFDLSMPSMIGFISLAGIVVNDSILLVAFIKDHESDGQSLEKAAVMAAKARFRAIFITSATTIAGTLPLLLETSLQAQVVQPLVVSMVFGMALSTLLIVFVLPSIYVLLEDFNLTSKHHLHDGLSST